jgi:hypothetical protein
MLEAQGEDSAKSRKDAKAMAIIQAGLGMMGGTSPNAFANIAAGAMPAIQGYQQALQGLRKDDRERIGKLMEMGISKEKLGLELKKLGIEDKKADAMVNLYNARAGAAGSGAGAGKEARLYAFKAGQDLNRVETDVARLRNSEEYKKAKGVLAMPFDPKKSSPALVNMRTEAQATIDAIEAEAKRRLNTAKDAVTFYNREAGIDKGDKSGKEDVDLNQFFKKP